MFTYRGILLTAVLSTLLGTVQAQQLAPINPAFIKAINEQSKMLPNPVLLPPYKPNMHALAVYPATFDLRTSNRSAPVRDQGLANACWAFSSIASIEGRLRPSDTTELSEMNVSNRHGFDWPPDTGGNANMAAAYYARWDGPVRESDDPFEDLRVVSPGTVPAYAHVQEDIILPPRASATDNDIIKYCVQNYGPVGADLYWDDYSYTPLTASIYVDVVQAPSHEVSIIGWDDNYPKTNFQMTNGMPPGNGAFLFKNSWSTYWGQSGYGWVSYYDVNLAQNASCMSVVQPATNYQHIYQYDPLGYTRMVGYGQDSAYGAAIYTAAATEQIQAVAFYTPVVNTSYQAMIYLDPTTGPIAGSPNGTTSGTIAYPGYHTITLASPVSVTAGQKFSVVVKWTTPSYNFPISFESVIDGYTSGATASPGQTYISKTGTSWSDLTSSYPNSSVCIKAFGKPTGTTRSISGQVTLNNFGGDAEYENLQAQVKRTDVSGPTVTMPLMRNVGGGYRIDWLPSGTYSMRISGSHFPGITVTGLNVSAGNLTGQNLALPNGDADGNGQVNLFDFVQLDMSFGQTGMGLSMDLDGSHSIDLFDYVVIDQNFGVQASTSL